MFGIHYDANMPVRVAVLDLLCERPVYGPQGNAAAVSGFGDVEILALNPQLESLEGWRVEGEWEGIPFRRVSMPENVEAWFDSGISALVISGSRSNLTMPEEWMEGACEFVRRAVEYGVPTLGICFGHQLLAKTFGGKLERAEEGFHEISTTQLTSEGRMDPLFSGCSEPVEVIFTHQDHVIDIPERARLLSSAEHTVNAAFRLYTENGEAMQTWGLQFHPESTADICRYASSVGDMPFSEDDERIARLAGTRILQNFADIAMKQV